MTDPSTDFTGLRILVVDDEETQCIFIRDCLENENFVVSEAVDGPNGLEAIRSERPDLVLLDVTMPGMDGFEVCRRVRIDPEFENLPIVIVTSMEDAEDIRQGFAAGATDFLIKPVDWNLLPYRIRFVLKNAALENDLRSARDEAERASAAKSKLLATMGHELRTPLNAIIGFSELVIQQPFGPLGAPQYEEYLGDIHDSGSRLLRGINDILEIVNSESESTARLRGDANLAEIAAAAQDAFMPEAKAGEVTVTNEVPPVRIPVRADVSRLSQAYFNLVSNAVKFTPPGGSIRLHLDDSEPGRLALAVTDTGIGIAEENLSRILEPFEQVDDGLNRNYEGMGLGLSVARVLARRHGGDIVLQSELGKGTTASLVLPVNQTETEAEDFPLKRTG